MPSAEGSMPRVVSSRQQASSPPLLTVVIATLNAAVHLPRSLGSLVAQQTRDFEVVVVDGGSRDETCQLAANTLEAGGIDHRILDFPGSGIYAALNCGFLEAKGEWVYIMGADDQLMNEEVMVAMAPILHSAQSNVLVVHGDVWIEEPGYRYGQPWNWPRFLERNISHQSAFYRRRAIAAMGIVYNDRYRLYADWDYNLQLFARGLFQYCPVLVASYACTGASSRAQDELFLAEKERNARRYLGWRSVVLLPPHRLALASEPRPGHLFRLQLFLNRVVWALKRQRRAGQSSS